MCIYTLSHYICPNNPQKLFHFLVLSTSILFVSLVTYSSVFCPTSKVLTQHELSILKRDLIVCPSSPVRRDYVLQKRWSEKITKPAIANARSAIRKIGRLYRTWRCWRSDVPTSQINEIMLHYSSDNICKVLVYKG